MCLSENSEKWGLNMESDHSTEEAISILRQTFHSKCETPKYRIAPLLHPLERIKSNQSTNKIQRIINPRE